MLEMEIETKGESHSWNEQTCWLFSVNAITSAFELAKQRANELSPGKGEEKGNFSPNTHTGRTEAMELKWKIIMQCVE